jgi:hypothetical protein
MQINFQYLYIKIILVKLGKVCVSCFQLDKFAFFYLSGLNEIE